jgi:hypothetical protein
MLPVDADSHFFEPLDLFERYIDSRFRERAFRVEKDVPANGPAIDDLRRLFDFAHRRTGSPLILSGGI